MKEILKCVVPGPSYLLYIVLCYSLFSTVIIPRSFFCQQNVVHLLHVSSTATHMHTHALMLTCTPATLRFLQRLLVSGRLVVRSDHSNAWTMHLA